MRKKADSRTNILSHVRSAVKTARLPSAAAVGSAGAPPVQSGGDTLQMFIRELRALDVTVHVEDRPEGVQQRVASLLANRHVLSWRPDLLPYDLAHSLSNQQFTFGDAPHEIQAQAEVGLTGVDAAIAETGSLVLLSGAGKPRTASLLPFEHVAVCRRKVIVQSMGDIFRDMRQNLTRAGSINIISGPSRTADIEMQLTLGVHGPGKLTVIIGP